MIANSFPLLVIGSMSLFGVILAFICIEDAIRHPEPAGRQG
jgi:hypothetical protein